MKVRCIKDYEYKQVSVDDVASIPYGEVLKVDNSGIMKCVRDSEGDFVISLGDDDFYKYFEIIHEEPEHNIKYSFIKEMLINVADLIDKKNKDYGNSYHTTREKYGHTAFLIRLSDKISRYEQLIKNDRLVEDESLIDTLEDIIGYTALEIEYLSGGKE